MAFQRSYSKVWWGNSDEFLSHHQISLGRHHPTVGNLSRIQESADGSKLSNNSSYESPGSLRSQDSGFSDNEESSHFRHSHRSPRKSSDSVPTTPSSTRTVETPPTVIRRRTDDMTSSSPATQRLSFSAPSSPIPYNKECDIIGQIDRISLVTNIVDVANKSDCKCSTAQERVLRRRSSPSHVSNPKTKRTLIGAKHQEANVPSSSSDDDELKAYHNETVYLGLAEDDNNNLKTSADRISSNKEYYVLHSNTPLRENNRSLFSNSTSTPKAKRDELELPYCDVHTIPSPISVNGIVLPYYTEYSNPRLNGQSLSVQHWLDEIHMSYSHEVMSTLQTKSIAQEAFRNLRITTSIVAKIVRQLQTRSLVLQGEFERVEKLLRGDLQGTLRDSIVAARDLTESVENFAKVLGRRSVFFAECRDDLKKFQDSIDQMRTTVKDLIISLNKNHYLEVDALYEDMEVLKRCTLITLRLVFEQLIRVIISNIENTKCDLVLRANLNMVTTLSNIDYTGFASLNDAFLKTNAVRTFTYITLDSKFSSVRALALRALATICSSNELIKQFGDAGGVEIIKDILSYDQRYTKRTEPEKREAVSLLTQITAPWHGSAEESVIGLKESADSIVCGLTGIVEKTVCCQTLLLCAASLNNLSRLEVTSVYSIMSNETIVKLKEAIERRGPGVSIFIYEQVMGMLYNMSGNKKCHSHLANKTIISFIASTFQTLFYQQYPSRAESNGHRKTIKTILHIFSRLIHESVLGQEILEENFVPIFSKIEREMHADSEHSKDISFVNQQMTDSLSQSHKGNGPMRAAHMPISSRTVSKMYFSNHESYV